MENEKTRKRCLEIVEEAKGILENTVSFYCPFSVLFVLRMNKYFFPQITEKKKKLKKEGKDTKVEEDVIFK